ncbi:MAG: nitrate- and nitrite sensing domain-containing protein [Pseudomonadota bacterium]
MNVNSLTMTRIVWIVALIGLALAMVFAVSDVWRNWSVASNMRQSAQMVELSVALSDMVHEQQKERGASAVFLTSKGQTFRSELKEQRGVLDTRRETALEKLTAVQGSGVSEDLGRKLAELQESMARVKDMRARVDALQVTSQQAVDFYTDFNRAIIQLVGNIAEGVADPDAARELLIYSALLSGKDYTGLYRSAGASGFAVGAFDARLSQQVIQLPALRQGYFDYVLALASDEQAKALSAILSSPKASRMSAMQETALSGNRRAIARISANDWFDLVTSQIGDLKALEDAMAGAVTQLITDKQSDANFSLFIGLGLLVGGFGAAGTASVIFVRRIQDRIKSVVTPLDRLSNGETDMNIPDHSANDFAPITAAMRVFQKSAIEKKEADEDRHRVVAVLRERLSAMAAGDLETPIDEFFAVEFKGIRMDFNEAQGALRELIHSVVGSAREINHGADEVKEAADDLSERTTIQASTLEETAAALQRTNTGIQESAQLAQTTNTEVAQTRADALENGKIVKSAVDAMDEIKSSFAEVEKITNMIQDIAFQTNILALNAGVEATRAGEAGKGFGVVATEVRALAQRSSEAVTEIQQLMARSGEKIAHGSDQVTASGDALSGMIEKIDRISERVAELASASGSQAEGLNEVNASLRELERATQQNAAMAEESSAASNMLNTEVRKLNERTSVFVRNGAANAANSEGTLTDLRMSA